MEAYYEDLAGRLEVAARMLRRGPHSSDWLFFSTVADDLSANAAILARTDYGSDDHGYDGDDYDYCCPDCEREKHESPQYDYDDYGSYDDYDYGYDEPDDGDFDLRVPIKKWRDVKWCKRDCRLMRGSRYERSARKMRQYAAQIQHRFERRYVKQQLRSVA